MIGSLVKKRSHRHREHPGFSIGKIGPFGRIRTVLFSSSANHVLVIRLMLAATLALLLAYSVGVSGGMVTVIAVLFMPSIPHSIIIGIGRFLCAILGCALGWILGNQFAENPLILFVLLAGNALFFFYLLAKGLPIFIMILMSLMPVGFGWLVVAGKSAAVAQEILIELLCGVIAMQVVSLVWPDKALDRLRSSVGNALCGFSQTYHQMFQDPESKGVILATKWRASANTGFNTALLLARSEVGTRNRQLRQMIGMIDQLRQVLPWPGMLYLFLSGGKYDKWAKDLSQDRSCLHECIKETTLKVGTAIHANSPHVDTRKAHEGMSRLEDASNAWLKENREQLDLEQVSMIFARCDLGHEMNGHLERIVTLLQPEHRRKRITLSHIPPTVFANVKKGFDSAAAMFAIKATTSVFISFLIGLIYFDWSGCLILILLSGFLAPFSFGGLTANFIDRLVGLILAAVVALFCILLVIPDINDVGVFLVVLAMLTYPFWLLATNPITGALGLSALMASFYILTGANEPSASLSPVETRVLAVGGATLVSYLVFLLVMPVTALQIVSGKIDDLLKSISRITMYDSMSESDQRVKEEETIRLADETVRALGNFDQLVCDLRWELSSQGRYARVRTKLLAEFSMVVPLLIAGVNLGVRFPKSQTSEFMALRKEMKKSISDFFLDMARYTSGPDAGSFPLEPGLFRCIEAHERLGAYLERGGYIDRAIIDEDQCARVALIYHAYHRVAIRRVRLIRRLLVVRFEESRRVNSQKVARTA